ncbi:MAG: malto-oligosyltrehalose trehalohydrolase [Bdellovibrionota bacterium]
MLQDIPESTQGRSVRVENESWVPTLGAVVHPSGGTSFRVWAPLARRVDLLLETESGREQIALEKSADGTFCHYSPTAGSGDRYRYLVDGSGPFPDPASRYQPEGVHGPSQIVDASDFEWSDGEWQGLSSEGLVIYELHVGTFTPHGTFADAMQRLEYLRELGVTAVEIMPVGEFAGFRNWGYDGTAIFAPFHRYGEPDDFRRFVDKAHELGLGVILDVVYNHFGPDGNYAGSFSPQYFSSARNAWAQALNLDGPGAEHVREHFLQNAMHWVHEYHIDGLRLDATHALLDSSENHLLAELSRRLRESTSHTIILIAEDERNLNTIVRPLARGGFGFDGVWADDFHHQLHKLLTGENEGYYGSFSGSTADLATTLRQGWFFCGQPAPGGSPRGTDPRGLPRSSFVWCIQNHDQIGNRALGERLHHQISLEAYRAASVLFLFSPCTPLLFMGQEWAVSTPFQFFTDHEPELGRAVTAGRRSEFSAFRAFADPELREQIPDPQDWTTFERCRLNWDELRRQPHQGMVRLYRELLAFRAANLSSEDAFECYAADEDTVVLIRTSPDESMRSVAAVRLRGAGSVCLAGLRQPQLLALSTEDSSFTEDPHPLDVESTSEGLTIRFVRPGAAVVVQR